VDDRTTNNLNTHEGRLAGTLETIAEHYRYERYQDCVRAARDLLAAEPGNRSAWQYLGHAYYKLERWAEARSAYEQSRPGPCNPLVPLRQAECCHRLGQWDETASALRRVIAGARCAPMLVSAMNLAISIGDVCSAFDAAERLRTIAPHNLRARAIYSKVCELLGS